MIVKSLQYDSVHVSKGPFIKYYLIKIKFELKSQDDPTYLKAIWLNHVL